MQLWIVLGSQSLKTKRIMLRFFLQAQTKNLSLACDKLQTRKPLKLSKHVQGILTKTAQLKSAEYEKPRNSSCIAWVRTDCTGVRTGVTLVNSVSKLLVSVALVIVGTKGGATLL